MDLTRFPVDKASFDGPVLVTGAGGCIGSWALALLTNAGVPAVAFDLSDDRRRPRLLMTEEQLARIPWVTGDIADTEAVADAVARHDIRAIIHLAALQVPFCKADPLGRRQGERGRHGQRARGRPPARPEAGRVRQLDRRVQLPAGRALARHPVRRLQAVRRDDRAHLCRGLGRAQRRHPPRRGLWRRARSGADLEDHRGDPRRRSGATLYRAVLGRRLGAARGRDRLGVHPGGVQGARRCAGVRSERPGDLGRRVAAIVRKVAPGAQLAIAGDPLPFPADLSDEPVRKYLGDYGPVPLKDGIEATYAAFRRLLASGALSAEAVA